MNTLSSYGTPKLLCSVEGEAGAARLLEKLRSGQLKKEMRPNMYPRYTGDLEERDYLSYCKFLSSINGKIVLNRLEEQDGRDDI